MLALLLIYKGLKCPLLYKPYLCSNLKIQGDPMNKISPHTFHIPVMGLAYTIDSPVKVARFGISSVVSIGEDNLVEMMRSYYYAHIGHHYFPITKKEVDYRAKRITDYLNLMNRIVKQQVERLKKAAFEAGSELVQYFEMLPDNSKLKQVYRSMQSTLNPLEKETLQSFLRSQVAPGSIDVNIMTKLDRDEYDTDGNRKEGNSEAISALRGYANSELENSSIVFSAGMNPRLFSYMEGLSAFDADEKGVFNKKIIIKVSDYRSALIQGKFLAKKGIWVSEYRIESGLNCGGHAFATDGFLMGPILEEFRNKRHELYELCLPLYREGLKKKKGEAFVDPEPPVYSVQGGIGTYEEHKFLLEEYGIHSNGWGTPFLLVPEATTVDKPTLELLSKAKEKDLELSYNSPLGVRFHYLKNTSSHLEKQDRILKGRPGSPCSEKHLAFNTEFTSEPICTASAKYQKLKIEQIAAMNLDEATYEKEVKSVTDKECLCVGLSNSAAVEYDQTLVKNRQAVTICPGPNIAYFSRIVSLQTMTDHIYGRTNIITSKGRPHMFIKELELYIDYLQEQQDLYNQGEPNQRKQKELDLFYSNLVKGIQYYHSMKFRPSSFYEGLKAAEKRLLLCRN